MFMRSLRRPASVAVQSTQQFTDTLTKNQTAKKITVGYFTAAWCGPCKMVAPHVETLSDTFKEKASVLKIDIDANGELAEKNRIAAVPTFIVFDSAGKEVQRVQGANIGAVEEAVKTATGA